MIRLIARQLPRLPKHAAGVGSRELATFNVELSVTGLVASYTIAVVIQLGKICAREPNRASAGSLIQDKRLFHVPRRTHTCFVQARKIVAAKKIIGVTRKPAQFGGALRFRAGCLALQCHAASGSWRKGE